MKVIDLVRRLGMWNYLQILDWDVEDVEDDNESCEVLFKGYAEDCPYKYLNLFLVDPRLMESYDNSPLSVFYDAEEKFAILNIWITQNDDWEDKNLKKF